MGSGPTAVVASPNATGHACVRPLGHSCLRRVVTQRHPSTVLPALNKRATLGLTVRLTRRNILRHFNIRVVNTSPTIVHGTRSHKRFHTTVGGVKLSVPHGFVTRSVRRTRGVHSRFGTFPLIVHPNFALNNANNNVTHGTRRFSAVIRHNLVCSPADRILVRRSVRN